MKLTRQDILLIIIGGLVIWNIISTRTTTTDVRKYQTIIKELQTKVDSTAQLNSQLNSKIDILRDSVIPSLTQNIKEIDKGIGVIKRQTNEKVNSVDTLSLNELEQFFTDRYNKSQN